MDSWIKAKSTRLSGSVANLADKQADEYGNDSDDESGSDAEAEDTDPPSEEEDE